MTKVLRFLTPILMVFTALSTQAQSLSPKPPTTLDINRKKIDSLDSKIIETIGLREKLVKEIGVFKAMNHIPPLQASRFQAVLEKSLVLGKQQELSEAFVTELMNAIHKESLRIENAIKNTTGKYDH
jgi:chorismate mutase